jgi:branched-subunit amino acid aminotransferase/4-amino-4-deoxychorismate lyase
VRAEDQGFQHGLAVYDGMLLDKGCRIFEEQHIARLEHAARALEITWPLPISIRSALDEYVAALGEEGPLLLRTQISRGVGGVPTVVITSRDVDPWPYPGIKVTVEARAKVSSSELEQLKSTNRLRNVLAREAAVRAGAWEALLMTEEGDLTEGTVSNLFCVLDGVVLTPPVERGLLPGIVRAELLAELSVRGDGFSERQLGLAEISRASEVFLTNTSGRLIPVVNVIGVNEELPGALGPRWGELSQIFREREERDMDASRSGSS